MEQRAWKSTRFSVPDRVPTMITTEEMQYLYWLGRSAWTGRGDVVEIGPWLGGSTVCLAAGMRASGKDAGKRLRVYDNFIWRDFMARRGQLPLQSGESFQPWFLENVRDYDDIVDAHARALPDETIASDREATGKRFTDGERVEILDRFPGEAPIEIVFIDGAKSWRGMRHLLALLRDRLIPGTSLFVCQDFKYWGTYWVPAMMARIEAHVTAVHNVLSSTTVTFRLTSAIPAGVIDALEDHVQALDTERALAELDRSAAMLATDGDAMGRRHVILSRVMFLAHQGHVDRAVEEFRRIERQWPAFGDSAQLEIARDYLRTEKGRALPRAPHLAIVRGPLRLWRRGTGVLRRWTGS